MAKDDCPKKRPATSKVAESGRLKAAGCAKLSWRIEGQACVRPVGVLLHARQAPQER